MGGKVSRENKGTVKGQGPVRPTGLTCFEVVFRRRRGRILGVLSGTKYRRGDFRIYVCRVRVQKEDWVRK